MPKVLVIDDDDGVRSVYGMALEDAGFEVVTAKNGVDGLALFKDEEPDLVITDIVMPDMDGVEVVSSIKEINPDTPIIAVSGGGRSGPDTYLEVCRHMGAVAVYSKPVSLITLLKKVEEILK